LPNLSAPDGLVLLICLFFTTSMGFALRPFVKTANVFLLAGRAMPAWVAGLALIGITLGGQELLTMGALGAHYGLQSAQFYGVGAIPALLFAGLYMMPVYYGSGARSTPEYLGLRFGPRTRTLYAVALALSMLATAGAALYAVARVVEALHIFDPLFYARSWPTTAILPVAIVLPALVVLLIVWMGGLTGALYSQVLEFFLIVAGLLPAVLLGLRHIGGWSGLKAALPARMQVQMHAWQGLPHAGPNSMGLGPLTLFLGLGIVLGGSAWCADFRFLQAAFAVKDTAAARRVPLYAAAAKVVLPLLLVVPGLLAITLPTPHTTTFVHIENGSIYHEINVVSPAAQAGQGVVPAQANPATGQPIRDAAGHPVLDYNLATPSLLLHYLPSGLLGLGLAALLAALMSGVAAGITAFNTVFTCDLYQTLVRKDAEDAHYLAVARWTTIAALALAVGLAFAASYLGGVFGLVLLALSFVNAPLFATFLAGMFSRRATSHGAFAGLVAGTAAAALHYGLTLPAGDRPGVHGGWIAVVHTYPNLIVQGLWTAIFAFASNLLVTFAVSLVTRPRPVEKLSGLVYGLTSPAAVQSSSWWKRPEAFAAFVLASAIAINVFFF